MIKDIVKHFKQASIRSLNYIEYGDPYNLLNAKDITYTAAIMELESSTVNGSLTTHNLRISVFDRLIQDESNLLDVFDVTRGILNDLIVYMGSRYELEGNYSIEYVKDDFADHLAGCYCTIGIAELTNYCSTYAN